MRLRRGGSCAHRLTVHSRRLFRRNRVRAQPHRLEHSFEDKRGGDWPALSPVFIKELQLRELHRRMPIGTLGGNEACGAVPINNLVADEQQHRWVLLCVRGVVLRWNFIICCELFSCHRTTMPMLVTCGSDLDIINVIIMLIR